MMNIYIILAIVFLIILFAFINKVRNKDKNDESLLYELKDIVEYESDIQSVLDHSGMSMEDCPYFENSNVHPQDLSNIGNHLSYVA